MEINYPIICIDGADIDLFYSVGEIETHLEPWALTEDYINDIRVYDREGKKISFFVRNKGDLRNERVTFQRIENEPSSDSNFYNGVISYLRNFDIDEDWLSNTDINSIVDKAIEVWNERRESQGCFNILKLLKFN
jgi:hypothetical protein